MGDCSVFAMQYELIGDILSSVQEQQAIEATSALYSNGHHPIARMLA